MANIKGIGVALVTPFKENKEVDYVALEKLVNYVIEGGVDNIVVFGTTGESATLNEYEKEKVFNFIYKRVSGRVPLIVGIGGNNTKEVIEKIQSFKYIDKVEAVLSVAPYYNKPSQDGIFCHFMAIAEASKKPIIIYNVPGRTSVNISAETTVMLANRMSNIIGIKEASGDIDQVSKIMRDKPNDFVVLSGDDAITLPLMSLGVDGVISVIANAFPKDFSEMIRLCESGEFKTAMKIHLKLIGLMGAMFEEGNPSGVKAFLSEMGIIDNYLRLPLVSVSDDLCKKIREMIYKY